MTNARLLFTTAILLVLTAAIGTRTFSQPQEPPAQPDMDEMMKKWMAVATPGEPHARFRDSVGEWKVVSKYTMPGMPPMSEGTATSEVILGGRFLVTRATGERHGQTFDSISIVGYDNYKKKYQFVYMDSLNTHMLTAEGLADRTGDVITYFGTMDEWMTGEHDRPVKYIARRFDENHHVFEIHDLAIVPGDTKVMEIEHFRKGKEPATQPAGAAR